MITFVRGDLIHKEPMSVTIDVNGMGFLLHISIHTFEQLPALKEPIQLATYLHVREDALQLFGFWDVREREMFLQLLTISGIGAKLALTILSGCGYENLQTYIASGNVSALTKIPGIGKKTADRIVVELRDKFVKSFSASIQTTDLIQEQQQEALMALIALGYPRQTAEKNLLKVIQTSGTGSKSTSDLIRTTLNLINS